jgi:hypothetical protein
MNDINSDCRKHNVRRVRVFVSRTTLHLARHGVERRSQLCAQVLANPHTTEADIDAVLERANLLSRGFASPDPILHKDCAAMSPFAGTRC